MLALVPVVLAYVMRFVASTKAPRLARYLIIAAIAPVWLAFLPNTCYLLTEWRHFLFTLDYRDLYVHSQLDSKYYLPLIELSFFYACYSGFGMIAFALAIRPVERIAARAGLPIWAWAVPFFALVSLGVYLGLVQRFNSWEPLTNFEVIWSAGLEAMQRPRLGWFILGFGAFLWMSYEALDLWIDAAVQRFRELAGLPKSQSPGPQP